MTANAPKWYMLLYQGVITVLPNAVLDREQTPVIHFGVEAYDCPDTPSQRRLNFTTVSSRLC